MTRNELFNDKTQIELEIARYSNADPTDELMLPVTKEGFEALMQVAADYLGMPVDDVGRQCIAGYIHHIDNDKFEVTIAKLAGVLYKSVANQLTWEIDQEIKLNRKKAAEAAMLKLVPNEEQTKAEPSSTP